MKEERRKRGCVKIGGTATVSPWGCVKIGGTATVSQGEGGCSGLAVSVLNVASCLCIMAVCVCIYK